MRQFLLLAIILASTQVPGKLAGQTDEWSLEVEENGVRVYVRPEAGSDMSVRVVTTAQTSVAAVKKVLDDAPAYPEWVHRCEEAYVAPGGTPDDYVYYSHIDMPFPFQDKEVVARIHQSANPSTGVLTRTITAEPDALPANKGRDRLTAYEAVWILTPKAGGRVEIICQVRTSAGSGLPMWLRKEIMTGGPAQTVANLKERLERMGPVK